MATDRKSVTFACGRAFHPAASALPWMDDADFDALVASIRQHGLLSPIVLRDGMILDGRHRALACESLGIAPVFREADQWDPEPDDFARIQNIDRRHLTKSQLAFLRARQEIAAEQAGDKPAKRNRKSRVPRGETNATDSATGPAEPQPSNIDRRTLQRARDVAENAIPEIQERVADGTLSVEDAAAVAALPASDQADIADKPAAVVRSAVKEVRRLTIEDIANTKATKLSEAVGSKRYSVIYADPPWRFEPRSRVTGMDRAADNHYPTLGLTAVKELAIPAADDCVLFLWATAPMLRDALDVMDAWGFEYRSQMVWVKPHVGTGYWWRNRHELLLLGMRGHMPAPIPGNQWPSVLEAPASAHSVKPERAREMIDSYFPRSSRVELFARTSGVGWDAWGNQLPEVFNEIEDGIHE